MYGLGDTFSYRFRNYQPGFPIKRQTKNGKTTYLVSSKGGVPLFEVNTKLEAILKNQWLLK
jgi:hypothetical protein